jgi:hypothetical protein
MTLRKWPSISFLFSLVSLIALACSAATAQPLGSAHWAAQWIWPSIAAIAPHENQFIFFRKTFSLAAIPSEASLSIFADSRCRLWVNGSYIGQGPARAPHYWSCYDTFDVAPKLRAGLNVIAVEVRWYGRGLAWYMPPPSGRFGAQAHGALLCQLEIGGGSRLGLEHSASKQFSGKHRGVPFGPRGKGLDEAPVR